jgi:amino acid adenylation domain-containing protein
VVCLQADENPAAAAQPWRLHGAAALAAQPATALAARAVATDPAYMIYTSGSTGRPKGAIVRHDGAVNHLFAQGHALGREAVGRFLQSAPSSSDISVWQFAAPLVFGGTTVIIDDPTDVENLHRQVVAHRLHLIELVPAVLKYLVEYARTLAPAQRALPDLRWAMVTGESASVELVNAWLAVYPDIPVVNAYGPTEAADDITQAIIREPLPPQQVTVPIGRPLANIDIYLLDDRLQPVPVGAPGEICVAGIGVGNGYWKQPDKTRQAFVANPFPGAAGPVIYRTGDLGRVRDDGTIECLGRLDHQVQLRGFRIELQEIESVLCSHAAVRDAVVKVFHDNGGDGQLVAFLVGRGADTASDEALRAHLETRLPRYMVPSSFVRLAQLPLNPAGKVDRKALQPPASAARSVSTPYRAPRTAAEQALAAIWQQELGAARVGIDDDFFALGGDSLAALAIAVGAREAGLHLRSADVLRHPTVAQLAATARPLAATAAGPPARSAPALHPLLPLDEAAREAFLATQPQYEDVQPLAPPQQGIFLHGLLTRDKTAYIDQYQYLIEGDLDHDAFEGAWNHLLARHASLRTAFLRKGFSRPVQAVFRQAQVDVELVDHSGLDAAAQQQRLDALLRQQLELGFDLTRPPLMRLVLVRTAPRLHRLVWTHHHIVLDGWSLSLVLDEVLKSHAAIRAARAPALEAPVPYRRVLDWLAAEDIAPAEPFWRQFLEGYPGAPELRLPAPAARRSAFAHRELPLDAASSQALVARAQRAGVTLTTLVQAAWASLLAALTGSDDVVFGVVTSGRELAVPRIDAIVGLLVTTLPLRVQVPAAAGPALDPWLRDLQQRAASLREHEAVPLAQIGRWCGLPAGRALFETLFVMSNYPELDAGDAAALRVTPDAFRTVPAYPLALIVVPGERLLLRLVHDEGRVAGPAASQLLQALAETLDGLALRDELAAPAGLREALGRDRVAAA